MLQKLNERVKGVVAWFIVILIAFTFALFGIDSYLQSQNYSDSALEVDGVKISKKEFDLYYRRARQQIDPATLTKGKEAALKDQIAEEIVNQKVALSAAKANGFYIDAQQANAAILAIPQFQDDGKFSAARYQQALSVAMYTPESFLQEVRQGMLMNQQRFAFMGTAFALPSEINRFVKLYFQRRDYNYLIISSKSFLDNEMVTRKEEKQYYESHQSEFLKPEKVSVSYITLSLAKEREKQRRAIQEQQVKNYYSEYKQNFIQPAKWQIAQILIASDADNDAKQKEKAEKISKEAQQNPSTFDTLKKQYTDDKLSPTNDKSLPWISAQQGQLGKVLARLTKVGEVSAPIKTKYGYTIYQVRGYKPAGVKSYDAVATMIKQQLVNSRAEKVFNEKLETLTDLTFQTPDSLEPAAKAVSEPILESSLFTRKGGNDDITKQQPFVQAAFSHEVLDLGNNSEQIQLDGDTVVFLRLKEHIPATEKNFDTVAKLINEKLKQQKAETSIKHLGQSFINGNISEQQLAKKLNMKKLDWKVEKNVSRESDAVSQNINNLAFSMQSVNGLAGKKLPNQGYLVIKLTAIRPGKKNVVDKEQRNSLKQQLESNLGMMEYDLYLNGLIKKADVDNYIKSGSGS